MALYNQGALTDGPFRLNQYPRSRAALRKALSHRRFPSDAMWGRFRMDLSKLSRSELIASLGGILLFVGVFLPWYVPNRRTATRSSPGAREAVSAWQAHSLLRYLFLAAAIAPLILAYIVVRDHELSWPRGELTAVVAIAAFGIIGYLGIIDRPGEPPGEIGLGIGWFLSMAGVILMMVGGAMRAGGTERPRKPPGVL